MSDSSVASAREPAGVEVFGGLVVAVVEVLTLSETVPCPEIPDAAADPLEAEAGAAMASSIAGVTEQNTATRHLKTRLRCRLTGGGTRSGRRISVVERCRDSDHGGGERGS